VEELPDLNHALQTAVTGGPEEYARIEETVAPVLLQLLGEWVVRHTARPSAGDEAH
jgi:hypothetical protein